MYMIKTRYSLYKDHMSALRIKNTSEGDPRYFDKRWPVYLALKRTITKFASLPAGRGTAH